MPFGPIIPLAPPEDGQRFESLQDLIEQVNKHAAPRGYAVVIDRTKKSKLKVTRKAWLICDRGGRIREPQGQERRHTTSRANKCPFSLIAKRMTDGEGPWSLEVVHSAHNHDSTLAGAHPVHRKAALNDGWRGEISRALTVQTKPSEILSNLRLADPVTGVTDDYEDPQPIDPLFKRRDIYNIKAQMRRAALGPLTPIQALLQEFDKGDWMYAMQKDAQNRITHLFFMKGDTQEILETNYEVRVMDCTYKTNRYRMPLMIISGQTALNSNFYVAFCFMAHETRADYLWVMQQLSHLYTRLGLPSPVIIVTDMKLALLGAIEEVFPTVTNLLCIWHINNNVLVNCRPHYESQEEWEVFLVIWREVMYAASEPEFWQKWSRLCETIHGRCIGYLSMTYLPHRHRFVRCFTNKVLHFGTTVTSRAEGGHAVLKRQLGSSTGDLKTVVDTINLLLFNQLHDHTIAIQEAKSRFALRLRKPVFLQLTAYVSSYALGKIHDQYSLIVKNPTALTPCTHAFNTTMGLPCSHQIQARMLNRIAPPPNNDINPLLLVENPQMVRARGRPRGALNRREQAFEASTNRLPSLFEQVESQTNEEVDPTIDRVMRRADPAPGRGRGRARGRARGGARGGAEGVAEGEAHSEAEGEARPRARGGARSRARGGTIAISNDIEMIEASIIAAEVATGAKIRNDDPQSWGEISLDLLGKDDGCCAVSIGK